MIKNLWQGMQCCCRQNTIGDTDPFCEAYNVSRQTNNNERELRLECLFWRIWGSQRLSTTITLQSLDRLVMRIMAPSSLHELSTTRRESQVSIYTTVKLILLVCLF